MPEVPGEFFSFVFRGERSVARKEKLLIEVGVFHKQKITE